MIKLVVRFYLPLSLLLSCSEKNENNGTSNLDVEQSDSEVKYAEGFIIKERKGYKELILKDKWSKENRIDRYVLYKGNKPDSINKAVFIKIPVESIACMSLTHVAFIERLGLEKSIVALSGSDYVSSPKIKKHITQGGLKELGPVQNMNYEVLVEQNPDIVMCFGIDATSNGYLNKMRSLGQVVVLNTEYRETHPLGKAEWIKFIAAFYDKDAEALTLFDSIESRYNDLCLLTLGVKEKPTVFTGMPWNGSWYVPGAKSFQACLFKDAGANYIWSEGNNNRSSFVKSEEIIINDAYIADYWLNLNSYKTMEEVLAYSTKFKSFKSVANRSVYNNDKRTNSNKGNDYWESGVANPDIILKDLIEIFHPKLIEHQLYYYRKVE